MKWLKKIKIIYYILKGDIPMVTVYVTLIVKGYKTYTQVPELLKGDVKTELEALELGHLAV